MKANPLDYVLGMFKKPEPVKAEPKPKAKRRKRKVKA
jgi:hypothetical protein